eukprot:XP_003979303.1 PREDICTED: uncharacterized protein LOC101061391 [Takifugu rubripes]
MESLKLALYIPCFCLWSFDETSSFVYPVNSLLFANVGENVTLQCSCKDKSVSRLQWYKQTQGEKPKPISMFKDHDKNVVLSKEFQIPDRFSVNITEGVSHLKIVNLRISDSGTYYCTSSLTYEFKFEKIYLVHVKSSVLNIPVEVHQSPSGSFQSGGSVTLNCRVHTGICDEEHTVYWFWNSGDSAPELIYTHGGKKEQCERRTNTCFYNLSMKNQNISDAGIYYCVVESCGRILFGDRTKLEIGQNKSWFSDHLVYYLTGALVFTTMLCVLLAIPMLKQCGRISSHRKGMVQIWNVAHMDKLPVHCRALCEHFWNRYLVQGYLSSGLKVFWS